MSKTDRRSVQAGISQLQGKADEEQPDAAGADSRQAVAAGEEAGQIDAAEDQAGEIEGAEELDDEAEHQEGNGRVGVAGRDELDEEGNEEQDGLGVGQADQEGGAERALLAARRRDGFVARRAAPALQGAAQQAEAQPAEVGGAGVFDDHEQRGRGVQQRGNAGGRQDHQDGVAGEDAAGALVAGGDAAPRGDGHDEQRVRTGEQHDEDRADDEGGEVGDAVVHAGF